MRPVTRVQPVGPAQAYQTFQVVSPQDTSVVVACEQAGCPNWRNGWVTLVDTTTELGARQAAYIRSGATGRSYTELAAKAGEAAFRFDSHQRCFAEHRTRPELYVVRGGDWRSHLGLIRQHRNAADWVEHCAEHQARLHDRIERG